MPEATYTPRCLHSKTENDMEEAPVIPNEKEQELPAGKKQTIDPAIEAVLKAIPDDKKEEAIKAMAVIQQEIFSGPIPHPRLLAEYEKLMPGSMDRFMKMAEQQQAHRMKLEDAAVNSQLKSNNRGQVFGFILATLVVLGGIGMALMGLPWFGVPLTVGMMAVLVVLFTKGKIHMDADLKDKKASIDTQSSEV